MQDNLPICLVVTSDSSKKSYVKQALNRMFYVIDTPDSFSAVDWLKNLNVEVIVLDEKTLDNPLSNLCKHIRKIKGYEKTPILLITNKIKKDFVMRALNAGVTDFIPEPLDENEIYQRIAIALRDKNVNKKLGFVASKLKKAAALSKSTQKLSSRFLMNEQALKEIQKIKKNQEFFSLLMLQIDSFQNIDTQWGDLVAENLSVAIRDLLKRHLRSNDSLFPQGGGRFLIILPKTSSRAAAVMAETILEEIHEKKFFAKNQEFSLTVSIGVAALEKKLSSSKSYEQFDSLLEKVHLCLKEAQKTRDRIVSN